MTHKQCSLNLTVTYMHNQSFLNIFASKGGESFISILEKKSIQISHIWCEQVVVIFINGLTNPYRADLLQGII